MRLIATTQRIPENKRLIQEGKTAKLQASYCSQEVNKCNCEKLKRSNDTSTQLAYKNMFVVPRHILQLPGIKIPGFKTEVNIATTSYRP